MASSVSSSFSAYYNSVALSNTILSHRALSVHGRRSRPHRNSVALRIHFLNPIRTQRRFLFRCAFPDPGLDPEPEPDPAEKVEKADWRAFRAALLQQSETAEGTLDISKEKGHRPWAHPLATPEVGCLLLAHPDAFSLSQHYFHHSVIFLFAHGNDGSAGVILNRQMEYKLGQLGGFDDLLPEFKECPLFMGGEVGANALHIVHGVPGLEGTTEIISGIYMGGIKSMKESVRNGQSQPTNYRCFVRYSGWGPGQLEREVAAGVWYLAACSKHFILKNNVVSPKPLWREVLELMGEPYSEISKRAYGES